MSVLLAGKPYFTNASRPPRGIADPVIALQFARSVQDVDDILSDAPSLDREVMRIKQYIDFAFIASYAALFVTLSILLIREPGWLRATGIASLITACATAAFDVLENFAILRILDLPLRATTPSMVAAIRSSSFAKWTLASVTLALLSVYFWRRRKLILIGALLALAAVIILYGLHDPRFLI